MKKVKIDNRSASGMDKVDYGVYRSDNGFQWWEVFSGVLNDCIKIAHAFVEVGYDFVLTNKVLKSEK